MLKTEIEIFDAKYKSWLEQHQEQLYKYLVKAGAIPEKTKVNDLAKHKWSKFFASAGLIVGGGYAIGIGMGAASGASLCIIVPFVVVCHLISKGT